MPAPKGGKALPKTKVHWDMITLTDEHPSLGALTFSFPRRMVAWPLSKEGPAGSGPNNKAAWWPYFQARHKIRNNYWVQGHMLNDNIHGPGEPRNLVPITGALNTNMLGIVERFAKELVQKGEVLEYIVEAHWESVTQQELFDLSQQTSAMQAMAHRVGVGYKQNSAEELANEQARFPKRKVSKVHFDWPFSGTGFTPTAAHAHPAIVRKNWGILPQGRLVWGEQFAPTRLSWSVRISKNWLAAPDWNPATHAFQVYDLSRGPEWNNNFP